MKEPCRSPSNRHTPVLKGQTHRPGTLRCTRLRLGLVRRPNIVITCCQPHRRVKRQVFASGMLGIRSWGRDAFFRPPVFGALVDCCGRVKLLVVSSASPAVTASRPQSVQIAARFYYNALHPKHHKRIPHLISVSGFIEE